MLPIVLAGALGALAWWSQAPWLGGLAAITLVAGLRWKALGLKVSLAGLSIAGGLLGVEFYLAATHPLGPIHFGPDYDRRGRREVIEAQRSAGVPAFLPFQPSSYVAKPPKIGGTPTIPLGGISGVTMVHCNSNNSGQYVIYESDEHGLNNPSGLWDGGPLEIAFVGDSFTHGACVRPGYADLVRPAYPRTMNLGRDGNGPLLELASLREFLPDLRPARVLWCYYEGNDARELNLEKENELLQRYLTPGFRQNLIDRQVEIDVFLRRLFEKQRERTKQREPITRARAIDLDRGWGPRLRLSVLRRALARNSSPTLGQDVELDGALFEQILVEAKSTVATWGGELTFVYLTGYDSLSRGRVHRHRSEVLEIVQRLGLPLVDTGPLLACLEDPLAVFPHRRSGHYTEDGVRLVADLILAALAGK
jgi:hypothetical protein